MDDDELLEIYGEYISLRDLTIASMLTVVLGFAGFLATPYLSLLGFNPTKELQMVLGLLMSTLGALLSLVFVKVKRVIVEVD